MVRFKQTSPLIIIGAARSGTNIFRDTLTSLPGVHTWPCDEIPYIWRYGNRMHLDDEFTREMAKPNIREYIHRAFNGVTKADSKLIVEKTCANSLRLGFVDETIPDARFVIIRRNGLDTVTSAMKRWNSSFDLRYSLAKAVYVPGNDLFWYGCKYLKNRVVKTFRSDKRLNSWGPEFKGMRELSSDIPLAELAARQWARCIERTARDLTDIDIRRVYQIRYENFVSKPLQELIGVLDFLNLDIAKKDIEKAVIQVHKSSIGNAESLSHCDMSIIKRITAPYEQH